jgi:hypothetical protein
VRETRCNNYTCLVLREMWGRFRFVKLNPQVLFFYVVFELLPCEEECAVLCCVCVCMRACVCYVNETIADRWGENEWLCCVNAIFGSMKPLYEANVQRTHFSLDWYAESCSASLKIDKRSKSERKSKRIIDTFATTLSHSLSLVTVWCGVVRRVIIFCYVVSTTNTTFLFCSKHSSIHNK